MQDNLPPEFECIAELVDRQPPRVPEVFHLCLATRLEESRKATLINTAQNGSTGAEGDHCGVIHSDE